MGRKPKHPDLKLIEGNRGHKAIDLNIPRPASLRPPCPRDLLDGAARKKWSYIVRELEEMGILARSDQFVIAAAANAWSRWLRAEEQLRKIATDPDKYTEVIKTKSGNWIQNPIVGIANAARDDLVRYSAELGLTPTSRTRIHIDKNANKTLRERMLS